MAAQAEQRAPGRGRRGRLMGTVGVAMEIPRTGELSPELHFDVTFGKASPRKAWRLRRRMQAEEMDGSRLSSAWRGPAVRLGDVPQHGQRALRGPSDTPGRPRGPSFWVEWETGHSRAVSKTAT